MNNRSLDKREKGDRIIVMGFKFHRKALAMQESI